jgi:hypothetical protein
MVTCAATHISHTTTHGEQPRTPSEIPSLLSDNDTFVLLVSSYLGKLPSFPLQAKPKRKEISNQSGYPGPWLAVASNLTIHPYPYMRWSKGMENVNAAVTFTATATHHSLQPTVDPH